MAVTLYRSSDASAPVLDGQTGSLVNVLNAVLVDGYGSKVAAGWTRPYSGTSKAVYRPSGGNQFHLRVQDDGPGAGSFREARIVGYESMSGVDTGVAPFPTVSQFANGLFVRKSTALSATARNWICVADHLTFWFFAMTGDGGSLYFSFGFGDFCSNLAADGYRTFIFGRITENSGATNNEDVSCVDTLNGSKSGLYVARNRNGSLGALIATRVSPGWIYDGFGISGGTTSVLAFPNGEDGGLYLEPIFLGDKTTPPANTLRGRLRGIWYLCHLGASFVDGDTFSGVGDLSGRSFMVVKGLATQNQTSALVVETSTTCDTSV
jgi:hypothetical protein